MKNIHLKLHCLTGRTGKPGWALQYQTWLSATKGRLLLLAQSGERMSHRP